MSVPHSPNSRWGFHRTKGALKWWCLPQGILQNHCPLVLFTLELLTSLWKYSKVLGGPWITFAFCHSGPRATAEARLRQALKHDADVLGVTQTWACASIPCSSVGKYQDATLALQRVWERFPQRFTWEWLWCNYRDSGSHVNTSSTT